MFWFCDFFQILKTVPLQRLKELQTPKLGMCKGYHVPFVKVYDYERGTFSVKNGIYMKA